jgi:hypothetical protein
LKATVTSNGETTLAIWPEKKKKAKKQRHAATTIELQHCDIIKDEFWAQRRWILEEE